MQKSSSSRYIPPEICEEILLNLPVKSLLRLSCVSKLWNSIILSSYFIKKYRGREILIGTSCTADRLWNVSSLTLSILSDNPTILRCPIAEEPFLVAFCDDLWCIQVTTSSLFLWNPLVRTYRKIRDPPLLLEEVAFIRGIGYDTVADDYKILEISSLIEQVELYSLRSDSWKNIQPPQIPLTYFAGTKAVCVNGTLHWIVWMHDDLSHSIISFNLSTEKFGELAGPKYSPSSEGGKVTASVSKGKLCMCIDYCYNVPDTRFVMWNMVDYGIAESWTKMFDICFDRGPILAVMEKYYTLTHLYSYDDGRILIKATELTSRALILLYDGNKILPMENDFQNFKNFFVGVEKLVSPNMW